MDLVAHVRKPGWRERGGRTYEDEILSYPEYKDVRWKRRRRSAAGPAAPRRLFGTWETPLPKALAGSTLVLQSIDTGCLTALWYGQVLALRDEPGYETPPPASKVTYWYTARDAFRTPTVWRTDLALTWASTSVAELSSSPRS